MLNQIDTLNLSRYKIELSGKYKEDKSLQKYWSGNIICDKPMHGIIFIQNINTIYWAKTETIQPEKY